MPLTAYKLVKWSIRVVKVLVHLLLPEGKGHVLIDVQVGEEGVLLKHRVHMALDSLSLSPFCPGCTPGTAGVSTFASCMPRAYSFFLRRQFLGKDGEDGQNKEKNADRTILFPSRSVILGERVPGGTPVSGQTPP